MNPVNSHEAARADNQEIDLPTPYRVGQKPASAKSQDDLPPRRKVRQNYEGDEPSDTLSQDAVAESKPANSLKNPRKPENFTRMFHERTLLQLSPKGRKLVADCFDAEGQRIRMPDEVDPPQRRVLSRYTHIYVEVEDWYKVRRTKEGCFAWIIPDFVWMQPDLSVLEKLLLGDVWHLQDGALGCFKSNLRFAIELGTSEGNVKDMIWRLKKAGYVETREDRRGSRQLKLSDSFHELVGQWKLTNESVETDDQVSRNLPPRQRRLTPSSVTTDRGRATDTAGNRADTGDSANPPKPSEQGTQVKDNIEKQNEYPASPGVDDDVAPLKPSATRGSNPLDPPKDNRPAVGDSEEAKGNGETDPVNLRAEELLALWSHWHQRVLGYKPKVLEAQRKAASTLVSENPETSVREFMAQGIYAWTRESITQGNGYMPKFHCRNFSRDLAGFQKYYQKILDEMGWQGTVDSIDQAFELAQERERMRLTKGQCKRKQT